MPEYMEHYDLSSDTHRLDTHSRHCDSGHGAPVATDKKNMETHVPINKDMGTGHGACHHGGQPHRLCHIGGKLLY